MNPKAEKKHNQQVQQDWNIDSLKERVFALMIREGQSRTAAIMISDGLDVAEPKEGAKLRHECYSYMLTPNDIRFCKTNSKGEYVPCSQEELEVLKPRDPRKPNPLPNT